MNDVKEVMAQCEAERQQTLQWIKELVPRLAVRLLRNSISTAYSTGNRWLEPRAKIWLWEVKDLPGLARQGLSLWIGSNARLYLHENGTKAWWPAQIEKRDSAAMKRLHVALLDLEDLAVDGAAYKSRH